MSDAPIRAFVCAPDRGLVDSIVRDLNGARVLAVGDVDPRAVRNHDGLGAILLSQTWTSPPATAIANAMQKLDPDAALVLLTLATPKPGQDFGPFDAAIRYPVGPPVLTSRVVRSARDKSRGAGGPAPEFLADLELRLVRMPDQNHYQLLGVASNANVDQIKKAYDRLSLRLHPDRLRTLEIPELRDGAQTLYVKITDAYQTLRNLSSRTRYDRSLQTGRAVETRTSRATDAVLALWEISDVPGAQKYLRLAHQAIVSKDPSLALVHMRFAATLDDGNQAIKQRIEALEATGA